jgi:hypothetical protein
MRMGKTNKEREKAWCLPLARTNILIRRSATAWSHWICSLFKSARDFSNFLVLASADLVDFPALALAAVAASKAFLEAASLASKDAMRALAVARAAAVEKREK